MVFLPMPAYGFLKLLNIDSGYTLIVSTLIFFKHRAQCQLARHFKREQWCAGGDSLRTTQAPFSCAQNQGFSCATCHFKMGIFSTWHILNFLEIQVEGDI